MERCTHEGTQAPSYYSTSQLSKVMCWKCNKVLAQVWHHEVDPKIFSAFLCTLPPRDLRLATAMAAEKNLALAYLDLDLMENKNRRLEVWHQPPPLPPTPSTTLEEPNMQRPPAKAPPTSLRRSAQPPSIASSSSCLPMSAWVPACPECDGSMARSHHDADFEYFTCDTHSQGERCSGTKFWPRESKTAQGTSDAENSADGG